MSLRLRLKTTSVIPICVDGIVPDVTQSISLKEVSRLNIRRGNATLQLNELFEVSGDPSNGTIHWEGDHSGIHWIGAKMRSGKIFVDGNCGRHLGSQMQGGVIEVNGNTGDYVACENRGGLVRIRGNANNWVGAAYPGTKSGCNGGTILVHGNVGHGLGFAMRRGMIGVAGDAGRLAGWNMLAGTILVGGRWGAMAGRGMKRGTLIATSQDNRISNIDRLPVSFTKGSSQYPSFLPLLKKWYEDLEFSVTFHSRCLQFHGDHLKGGRGEVFVMQDHPLPT